MRTPVRLGIVALVLVLGLLPGCSWQKPEYEEKEIPLGYRGEAKVKPFLAAARFLRRMGLPVEECFSLVKLPGPDTVLLLPAEGDRTTSAAQRLAAWVMEGGHVVYLLQGADSFINDFEDEARWDDEEPGPGKSGPEKPSEPATQEPAKPAPPDEAKPLPPRAVPKLTGVSPARGLSGAVDPVEEPADEAPPQRSKKHAYPFLEAFAVEVVNRIEDVNRIKLGRRRWQAEIPMGQGFLVSRDVTGDVAVHAAGPRGRRAFLSFPYGKGRATLVADAKLWRNRYIGEGDHASLLWEVVKLVPGTSGAWIVRSTKISLFELIWLYGRMPLASLGVFLALWLWWATRRFGPWLPDPEGAGRDFAHHLDMSGSFLWRQRAIAVLVEPVRRRIRARHVLHTGSQVERSEALTRLARRSGLDAATVEYALGSDPPRQARKLTALISQLQILDSLT